MNPAYSTNEPASSPHEITRRNFMKKTALTMGAITLLGQGAALAASCASCPAHIPIYNTSGACTYVLEIQVEFTGTASNPAKDDPDYELSGLQYTGTMKYRWNTCADSVGPRWTTPFDVYSGGHRSSTSAIASGKDTTCPQGAFLVTPNTTGHVGFLLDTGSTSPLRKLIEIHGQGVTTGCIAVKKDPDYNTFADRLRGNNFSAGSGNGTTCVHSDCKFKVTATVTYTGVTPNWE